MDIPKTLTGSVWVRAEKNFDGEIEWTMCASDMSQYGWNMVAEIPVTVDLPQDIDVFKDGLSSLLSAREELEKSMTAKIAEMDEKIAEIKGE